MLYSQEEYERTAINMPWIPPIPAEELIAAGVTMLGLANGEVVMVSSGLELKIEELSEAGYSALEKVNSFFSEASRQETIDQGFAGLRVVGERTPAHQKAYDIFRDHQGVFYPRPAEELIAHGVTELKLANGEMVQLAPDTELTIGELSSSAVSNIYRVFGLDRIILCWRGAHDTEALEEELGVVISEEKACEYRAMKIVGKRK